MQFDYTYITLFGFILFEPMVILANLIFFLCALYYYVSLKKFNNAYTRQMSLFMFLLGTSMAFGGAGHAIHYQLGVGFFNLILFFMNAFSLLAMYYCFMGPYTYYKAGKEPAPLTRYLILTWILLMLVYSMIVQNFALIKIHAGLGLIYALTIHWIMYKRYQHRGSREVIIGVFVAFLPIIVHSLKISFDEWFNHKDIAHVLMIISLVIICRGVKTNSEDIESGKINIRSAA
ncbi:MAG: hypothetical protein JNL60_06660 [Bacteroidia bacterium]|nr:hypothetical protein [Bacteroidia bacterium]